MKFIKYFLIAIVSILLLLVALPFVFKGKIVKLVKEQANQNLNATLNFNEDVSLSLLSNFPNFSLGIKDISLVGINEFSADTLYTAKNTSLVLDVMSVIKGSTIQIRKISLDQPRIKVITLKNGKANYDIAKADTTASTQTDTASSPFHLKLNLFEIKDGNMVYNDQAGDLYSEMNHVDYELVGDFSDIVFELKNKLSIASLTVGMGGMNYLNHVQATANANIQADLNKMKFEFKDNTFTLNNLGLALNGSFAMPTDDMEMNLTWGVKENEFKNLLSLIPAIYTKDFKDLQSKGKFAMDGFVKGIYSDKQMPAFGLNLMVDKGWFKYPSLPAAVENVAVNLAVTNADGNLNSTAINLSKFHLEMAGNPFDAKLLANNLMLDPNIDAMFKGKLDLGQIAKIVPLPNGTELRGMIVSDVMAKGRTGAITEGKYDEFDAKGKLTCTDLFYASADIPKPFLLRQAELNFSPKVVTLNGFDAQFGKSDFKMNGGLENFYAYYLGKGVLKGNLNFLSHHLDANELMGINPQDTALQSSTDTAAMQVVNVPANIDFVLSSKIDELLYTNLAMTDFVGKVTVKDEKISFENIGLKLLGSTMKMNGYYATQTPGKPQVDLDFVLKNLDFQKSFKAFNTVQKLAPAAENIFGVFDMQFKMASNLTQNMMPDYSSLLAEGFMSVPFAEIKGIKSINQITNLINKPEYQKVGLYKSKIKFKVKDGKVTTEPFDVKLGTQTLSLSGSTGLDQTINYIGTLMVPRKDLGAADQEMNKALAQLNKAAGSDIKMNEKLPLALNIGGTFTAPTLSTNLASLAKGELGSLKNQVTDLAMQKKKELEDKAKAEIEKAKQDAINQGKAEAERLKAEAKAKANAEADKLKKEAEAKAKAESDKLKNKAKDEAKDKLKGLFGKP